MKTKIYKSLWLFTHGGADEESPIAPANDRRTVGNPIVQAAYSATILKELREEDAAEAE